MRCLFDLGLIMICFCVNFHYIFRRKRDHFNVATRSNQKEAEQVVVKQVAQTHQVWIMVLLHKTQGEALP